MKRRAREMHGLSGKRNHHPLYAAWRGMRQRCHSEKNRNYPHYGGRGIKVCDRWFNSFRSFIEDVGERPTTPGRWSLDRIDNDGNYEPGNVRWALQATQVRNRRGNRLLTHEGVTMCATDWAKKLDMSKHTLRHRLDEGWTDEQIITTPLRKGGVGWRKGIKNATLRRPDAAERGWATRKAGG